MTAITQAEVREAFDRFVGALKTGDLRTLANIYSDDYLLVRPDGQALTKAQIMDELKQHSMHFTTFETNHVTVKILGRVGILTADTRNTFLRDGKAGAMHAMQVAVFVKSGGDVTVTHFQSTTIPDSQLS